ncbi:MAG: hypothetical protein A3H62_00410 [Candidatus Ryanbacteria bacterium RIFCSPLOWO2_02_FULL_44_40]|nr:MAG: hypothetical protein A3H62_00410 [Candidatus Ryanbacteria bacterium RIFCSPLOWO2_02_FULL_44_40]
MIPTVITFTNKFTVARSLVRVRELLIIANSPQLRDRGVLWFKKNTKNIQHAQHFSAFWKRNSITIYEHEHTPLSSIINRLEALGYARTKKPHSKGSFSVQGGLVHVAPTNTNTAYVIEFLQNSIYAIWKGQRALRKERIENKMSLITLLRDGDYVVHKDHGIGIWRGIVEERQRTYFLIEYAGPKHAKTSFDTLLVPLNQESKISPYIGFRSPFMNRLGTPLWKNTLKKTKQDSIKFAHELLELFARRSLVKRQPYTIFRDADDTLTDSFEHEMTNAQKEALEEVFRSLLSDRPMDHLLMGDVGFGKTEVAIRIALQVILAGKQVAVLVPTTILADQHVATFSARLNKFPIIIGKLSRLETRKSIKDTLKKLKEGLVDIVIGTHRLLSNDVHFHTLGLLIIDEEQRFGVKAKEKLKHIKKESVQKQLDNARSANQQSFNQSLGGVDVLTLSATPLPRTLHLALSKLKNISVIDEAPQGRIAPRTFVLPYNEQFVKEAIQLELQRKGQVYFLANRIRTIPDLLQGLQKLLGGVRFGVLHGKLPETKVIKTMRDFRNKNIDVLISTTMIENGIDLLNANTLIVHDATKLGLAEAHQLRGRIGRGLKNSYAYFCFPAHLKHIVGDQLHFKKTFFSGEKTKAAQRLETLLNTQFLGSGETIARRDLEMRGVGNILGKEQAGNAYKVGMNLYCEILAEAMEELKQKTFP